MNTKGYAVNYRIDDKWFHCVFKNIDSTLLFEKQIYDIVDEIERITIPDNDILDTPDVNSDNNKT